MNRWSMIMLASVLGTCAANAQSNPLSADTKQLYMQVKGDIVKAAAQIPEEMYSFKPVPTVRTFGELVAHIADAQYEFCGPVKGEAKKSDVEHTVHTKAALAEALKAGFAYCDAVYNSLTDAKAAETVKFGGDRTKLYVLNYNTAHMDEHYGNLVTYMRIRGMVPPSSQPQSK
jgi:uncharacterized damage-inducible protein DinB